MRATRGYHHGNLREALVEAALALIAERGPAGFTFAELARAAGVTPAAPYRHFPDRDAVVAEVARRGFERFAEALERAAATAPHPVTAIEAVGRAYLAFARRETPSYAAMFQSHLAPSDPALRQASDRAFAVLRRAAEAACAAATGRRPPALMVALHIWSMAHGVATLFVTERRALPMEPEDLLEAALLIYTRSLGLEAPIN